MLNLFQHPLPFGEYDPVDDPPTGRQDDSLLLNDFEDRPEIM